MLILIPTSLPCSSEIFPSSGSTPAWTSAPTTSKRDFRSVELSIARDPDTSGRDPTNAGHSWDNGLEADAWIDSDAI